MLELYLLVHPRRIQRFMRCARVRYGERLRVISLGEFDERTWKRRLLEHPEAAVRSRVVGAKRFQPLRVVRALRYWNSRALDRHSARHSRVRFRGMTQWFSS